MMLTYPFSFFTVVALMKPCFLLYFLSRLITLSKMSSRGDVAGTRTSCKRQLMLFIVWFTNVTVTLKTQRHYTTCIEPHSAYFDSDVTQFYNPQMKKITSFLVKISRTNDK